MRIHIHTKHFELIGWARLTTVALWLYWKPVGPNWLRMRHFAYPRLEVL